MRLTGYQRSVRATERPQRDKCGVLGECRRWAQQPNNHRRSLARQLKQSSSPTISELPDHWDTDKPREFAARGGTQGGCVDFFSLFFRSVRFALREGGLRLWQIQSLRGGHILARGQADQQRHLFSKPATTWNRTAWRQRIVCVQLDAGMKLCGDTWVTYEVSFE